MSLRVVIDLSRLIESLSPLRVLPIPQLIAAAKLKGRRHLEERTSNICLAIPETVYDSVHVVDLQELEEFQI